VQRRHCERPRAARPVLGLVDLNRELSEFPQVVGFDPDWLGGVSEIPARAGRVDPVAAAGGGRSSGGGSSRVLSPPAHFESEKMLRRARS
jgi:hypothetical protein